MAKRLDDVLPRSDQQRVIEAIGRAEAQTSGELKVHLEERCAGDAMERATAVFQRLRLDETRERNGVLIYVAIADHKIAVLGDQGIHAVVGDPLWRAVVEMMRAQFIAGRMGDGLVTAIEAIGGALAERFPPRADDANEIDDRIGFGDAGPDRGERDPSDA